MSAHFVLFEALSSLPRGVAHGKAEHASSASEAQKLGDEGGEIPGLLGTKKSDRPTPRTLPTSRS